MYAAFAAAHLEGVHTLKMIKLSAAVLATALFATPALAQQQVTPQPAPSAEQLALVQAILPIANNFVTSVDGGNYQVALGTTAAQFRQSLGTNPFATVMANARGVSGQASGRNPAVVERFAPPAEAQLPAGQYARVVYQTQFAKWGPSVEAVVLFQEGGAWKVSHYFAQPMPQQQPQAAAPAR